MPIRTKVTHHTSLMLNNDVVIAAKKAYIKAKGLTYLDPSRESDLEHVAFRDVVDHALEQHKAHLDELLTKVGLIRRKLTARTRPVSISTWDGDLQELSNKFDIDKRGLIQCAFELLAATQGTQTPPPTTPMKTKRKGRPPRRKPLTGAITPPQNGAAHNQENP